MPGGFHGKKNSFGGRLELSAVERRAFAEAWRPRWRDAEDAAEAAPARRRAPSGKNGATKASGDAVEAAEALSRSPS